MQTQQEFAAQIAKLEQEQQGTAQQLGQLAQQQIQLGATNARQLRELFTLKRLRLLAPAVGWPRGAFVGESAGMYVIPMPAAILKAKTKKTPMFKGATLFALKDGKALVLIEGETRKKWIKDWRVGVLEPGPYRGIQEAAGRGPKLAYATA